MACCATAQIVDMFTDSTKENDIALLKINGTISFSSKVQPACLPDRDTSYDGVGDCMVSGWGRTVEGIRECKSRLRFGFTVLLYNVIVKYECRVGSRAQEHFNLKFPVKLFLTMAPIAE